MAVGVGRGDYDARHAHMVQGLSAGKHGGGGADAPLLLHFLAEVRILLRPAQGTADGAAVGDGIDAGTGQLLYGPTCAGLHLHQCLQFPTRSQQHPAGEESNVRGPHSRIAGLRDGGAADYDQPDFCLPLKSVHQNLRLVKSRNTTVIVRPITTPSTMATPISNVELVLLALQEPLGGYFAAETLGPGCLVYPARH